ncbi:MAG: DMT family transporter [Burkholderiales bacterium]|jgi:drug/metabolite transporter (DMT)-like permease
MSEPALPAPPPTAPASSDPRRAALWMLGALVSFSMVAISGREAMRAIGALELLAWRAAVGLAILLALWIPLRARGATARSGQPLLTGGRALVHFGAQYAWMAAVALIPLVEVFALEFTSPLWVAVLAPLLLGEKLTRRRAVAALLGFVGALVVIWPPGAGPSPIAFVEQLSLGAGSLLALAAALGFAFNMMAVRRLTRTDSPFTMLLWMHVLQLPLAAALVAAGPGIALSDARTFAWAAVCGVAGLCAHYSLNRASKLADAIVVAPMDFLRVPLIAVVGAMVYSEPLRLPVLIGAAIILAANTLNLVAQRAR